MHCSACGSYYRLSILNKSCFCDDCMVQQDELYGTDNTSLGVETSSILNPSGRTMPIFYDDDDALGI